MLTFHHRSCLPAASWVVPVVPEDWTLMCRFTIISTTYASTHHNHIVIVCLKHVVICLLQVNFWHVIRPLTLLLDHPMKHGRGRHDYASLRELLLFIFLLILLPNCYYYLEVLLIQLLLLLLLFGRGRHDYASLRELLMPPTRHGRRSQDKARIYIYIYIYNIYIYIYIEREREREREREKTT